MIQIEKKFYPDAGFLNVDLLPGYIFTPESGAHKFIIHQIVDDVETDFSSDAAVECRFLKADNVTEYITGSIEDGAATVTLRSECYQVPGRFVITILVTDGSEKTCVYAATSSAMAGDSETIHMSDDTDRMVDEQIAAILAAEATADAAIARVNAVIATVPGVIESIPEDYTDLYNDVSDLKSAVKCNNKIIEHATINTSGVLTSASANAYDTYIFQTPENGLIESLKTPDGYRVYAFFTTEPILDSISYNASRVQQSGTETKNVFVPDGCKYIAIRHTRSFTTGYPSIYPQNAVEDAKFLADQQIGFKYVIPANADLNDYDKPGVYQYSTANNIGHDPFNGSGGTTNIINLKANKPGTNGSISQFAYQYGHMEKGFMFRQENSQLAWTEWQSIGIMDQTTLNSISTIQSNLTAEVARALGFRDVIPASSDLNDYDSPGVYQYSTDNNIGHDPFNGIGGTTVVFNIKSNTVEAAGSLSQFAYQYAHMDKGFFFRQEYANNWSEWVNIGIFDQASGASVPSTKVFGYSDFDDNDSVYLNEMRYRKVVYGNGKIYCGTFYGASAGTFPYYFSVIRSTSSNPANARYYNHTIAVDHYGITIKKDGEDVDFSDLRDGDSNNGNRMQISDMEYYQGYLYCAMRWGSGAPSDTSKDNSYLIVINAATMQTEAWFAMKEDRISTVHADSANKILVTGNRGGGFTVYDITIPEKPTELVAYNPSELLSTDVHFTISEYQHSWTYQDSNNDICIAFGAYTKGVAAYKLQITTNSQTGKRVSGTVSELYQWNNLSAIGSDLNVFSVVVRYPYLYATVCPMNSARQTGSRIMGIVTLDVSGPSNPNDPSDIIDYGFTKIPESMCGDYPAYIINNNGNLTLGGPADPAPNYIRANGNYLYVSNENKGIAVFSLASYKYPTFAGLIPTGTWNRYFSISNDLIFTGGDYDYLTGNKPKVVVTSCVLE